MTERTDTPQRRAARAVQATLGILVTSLSVGAFDWRAGGIAFGILTLATSGAWRNLR